MVARAGLKRDRHRPFSDGPASQRLSLTWLLITSAVTEIFASNASHSAYDSLQRQRTGHFALVCLHFLTVEGTHMKFRTQIAVGSSLAVLNIAAAQAVTLVGLNSQNQLARIDTSNVAGALNIDITGLASGDRLIGIDTRPKDGKIYGITLSNKIYTIDEMSGVASFVAGLSSAVIQANQGWGLDFNPVADAGAGASLRLIGSAGNNYAVNATTGLVGNLAGMIAPGYTAVAYTNSMPGQPSAPASTALYYINSNTDTLSMASGGFNAPTITTVGSLGLDVLKANGFEILGNGQAYAALNEDAGTSLVTGVYGIDLATGQAALLGTYSGTLSGLTVSAVPEPQTYAMLMLGLLGLGAVSRRRSATK
jgi:hypothetical protein